MNEQHLKRIVTRPDFDGIVCAVLLFDVLHLPEHVFWIEPYEIRHSDDIVRKGDIIANLPYIDDCALWFDHHPSNRINKPFEGIFREAPSAARLVFEYYEGRFSKNFTELVREADKIDSANFSIDEVLHPANHPYIMLYFTISGRNKSDENYWDKIIYLLGKNDVKYIINDPDVRKKWNIIAEQDRQYLNYIKNFTEEKKHVTITDFRSLSAEPSGNRFFVYTIFPDSYVNIKIRYDRNTKEKVIISLGQNIFNKKNKIHLGHLVSRYGGGGHEGAGSCHFHITDAQEKINEVIDILSRNEAID